MAKQHLSTVGSRRSLRNDRRGKSRHHRGFPRHVDDDQVMPHAGHLRNQLQEIPVYCNYPQLKINRHWHQGELINLMCYHINELITIKKIMTLNKLTHIHKFYTARVSNIQFSCGYLTIE